MKKLYCLLSFLLVSACFGSTAVINSFSAGELSPLLEGRSDVRKYYSGCRTLENMIVLPHGGATKRPGTYYVASAKDANNACRLLSFEYSVTQAYIIEMGNLYMRFYRDGGQIVDASGEPYEIATPYLTADLFDIQYVQSADTMYLVHPSYPPMKLTRTGHTAWTLTEIEFSRGPFLDSYICTEEDIVAAGTNIAHSDYGSVASEIVTSGSAVAYGNLSNLNDGDTTTTLYGRRATGNTYSIRTPAVSYQVRIQLGYTVEEVDYIRYYPSFNYTQPGDILKYLDNSPYTICYISTDNGSTYTEVGGGRNSPFVINGPFNGVTDIAISVYYAIQLTQSISPGRTGYLTGELYEIEVYGTAAQQKICLEITPSNKETHGRVLDDTEAAQDQGGTPNVVRFPCTGHGYLANDWVTISGCDTTAYNGVHQITNVPGVDDFDIEVAYAAETFDGDEEVVSRINMSASDSLWNANHVGAKWQLTHTVAASETTGSLTASAQSSSNIFMHKERKFDFTTSGTWSGTVSLQKSYDSGSTWKEVIPHTSDGTTNISYSDEEDIADCLYRVYATSISTGTCNYTFLARSHDVDGVVTITSYIDATTVRAVVDYNLADTAATSNWAEGAWSDDEGYPSSVCFYEERQCFAGTNNKPQTIWMSQTDDWANFRAGADDTDAIALTIAADQVNVIRWMTPQSALLVGTTGGEWKISATKEDEPMSPSNINAKRQSNYGCANLQAINIGNVLLYVQRQGQKVRKLNYSFELDAWVSPDLTILSEHITGDGITDIALMKNPYPILWCVRSDGDVAALTMEENQDVLGWSKHTFTGDVESVAVIPGTLEDEVWVAVERTIDSTVVRYIEQVQPFDWGSAQEDCFFVDSGLTFDSGDAVAVTNITQASPGVVTAASHGFSDGEQVRFYDVNGMTYINGRVYTVSNSTTDTFELHDKDNVGDIDTRGCIAHWKMDDNANTTTVEDVYGNDGTCTLTTEQLTVEGVVGAALYLYTSQDVHVQTVTIDDSDTFSFGDGSTDQPFSISLWWKNDVTGNDNGYGVRKYGGSENEYILYIDQSRPMFLIFDASEGANLGKKMITDVDDDTWYHIVGTYDGTGSNSGCKLYVDNVEQTTSSAVGSYVAMENGTNDLIMGGVIGDYLDDVRIFGCALSVVDISMLYNGGSGYDKPVGYCQYIDGGFVRQCENTFTTLGHLEGKTLDVLQDGGDAGEKTVSNGTITLDDYYYVVHAGLPYTAKLLPMKLELAGNPGSLFGQTKRITDVTIRFYNTSGCKVGTSWADYDTIIFRGVLDSLDEATPLFTDDKTVGFTGDFEKAGNVYIQNDIPMPFTVLAIMCRFEVEDKR